VQQNGGNSKKSERQAMRTRKWCQVLRIEGEVDVHNGGGDAQKVERMEEVIVEPPSFVSHVGRKEQARMMQRVVVLGGIPMITIQGRLGKKRLQGLVMNPHFVCFVERQRREPLKSHMKTKCGKREGSDWLRLVIKKGNGTRSWDRKKPKVARRAKEKVGKPRRRGW